ncbi:acyl-CoA dehydrogenase [Halococcus morrhuae DSM 1307]|uniref:Acyl-CoA dehydrogenase n=1 Tax=Halococcus morrhuae DSM 1307 TaxID=931277 RepID=M0MAC4_HALMO|nr:acyl-CoA dehydrogenase family protein [Halococcus morrhuae]EMA41350.1 acyl-CoA dehydrogenase [Halococcus morrhuae DSM 1307]
MDFTLSDEQNQMQESVRDYLESEGGIELARRQMDGEDVVDEVWDGLAEMDYPALSVPLEYGGLGDDLLYLSLLFEEAGRVALPGPLPETLGFTVPLLAELGTDEQKEQFLPAIADGDLRASVALYDDATESLPGAIRMEAEPTDDGYRLDGTKTLVPYAESVDRVVVPARTRQDTGYDGITLFFVDPAAAEAEQLDTLDKTRPLYELTFDAVEVSGARLGPVDGGGDALKRAIDRLNVSMCAMLVGGADEAVDRSVEYGKQREQFDKPIGQFQAVKHRIADMWLDTEAARSLTYYAAWAIANDEDDARQAVSRATWYCTERCGELFEDDIFNHGATGYTWDHDGHIFLKQAKTWANLLGSPTEHRRRIADIRL